MALRSKIKEGIKNFPPAYFALVMATGIVSTAFQQLHYERIASILFVLNNLQYVLLLLIFVGRLILFFPSVKTDLATHSKGAGFLTFVAGSAILGTAYVQAKQAYSVGSVLLIIAFLAWLIIIYSFLSSVILQKKKPSLETGINGSWLLLIVSTQSLVILTTSLAKNLQLPIEVTLFVTLSGWLASIMLYVIVITMIVYRLTFYPVIPSEVSPSYWIDTGAAAISTVTGATISNAFAGVTIFLPFVPVVNLFSLLFWSIAIFWLPLLLVLETWRHIKAGFTYSPDYWSMVFPLGMFSVATLKLTTTLKISFLQPMAHTFLFVAFFVWAIVFISMLISMYKALFLPDTNPV